ncbi:GNAT family N-acetyltransferase [Chryseobacterium sp. T1]
MITLDRTTSQNIHFRELVTQLDADLAIRNGEENAFFSQFNKIDNIQHCIVAYLDDNPAGCGALKSFSEDTMEIKRMYTNPIFRRNGLAKAILTELEAWAKELNYKKVVLETSKMQPEAIALYYKCGYTAIPNYGQYVGIESSLCFEKVL